MCSQDNVRATARDKTGQNIDKGHTSNPRIKLKFLTPSGIEPGQLGWKAGIRQTTPRRGTKLHISDINGTIKRTLKIRY